MANDDIWAKRRAVMEQLMKAKEKKDADAYDREFNKRYNAKQTAHQRANNNQSGRRKTLGERLRQDEFGNYFNEKNELVDKRGRPVTIRYSATHQRKAKTKPTVDAKFSKYLGKNDFQQSNGWIKKWAKPLSFKGGKNPIYGYDAKHFQAWSANNKAPTGFNPDKQLADHSYQRSSKFSTTTNWGAHVNQQLKGEVGGFTLNGGTEWLNHLSLAEHQLVINAESFRIAVGYRAKKVFMTSFKDKKFHSSGSSPWQPLAPYTINKRARRGTGSRIMVEYGMLRKAFDVEENSAAAPFTTSVVTTPVQANKSQHRKRTICFAGYHNNPRPGDTYGRRMGKSRRRVKPYVQRQFMGFSDKIDEFALAIMKRYLFDNVFLTKKV